MNTFLKHEDRKSIMILAAGLISLYTTMICGGGSLEFMFFTIVIISAAEFLFGFFSSGTISPYILMISSPITLIFYSTTTDFQIRITSLLLLAYILSAPHNLNKIRKRISGCSEKPLLIWAIPLIIFSLLSFWLDHKGVELSGDEPHYLMVTQSLVEDHDLSLKNNVEERSYMDFIPTEIPAHMIIHKGKHLSFHMPGLSFILIPFYIVFNLTGGLISPPLFFRLSISIINAFFPFVLFYLMRMFFPGRKVMGIWILSILSTPFLFHSVHIFPELPAATLLAGSFLFLYRNDPKPGIAGMLFSLTIWFHVKYYPPLILFAALASWKLFREHSKKDLLKFLIYPFVSSVALLLFSKAVYGTFNPSGIFPAENYWTTPAILKLKVFFAYFIDQRDGLFLYAPIFFFSLFRLRLRDVSWRIPAALIAVYTIFHAVTTVRGAHAPAGRPLIFILWIIVLFMAGYYFNSERKYFFRIMAGFNFFILFWILQYPQFIYQPVFSSTTDGGSSFLKFMGSSTLDLIRFFPSFLTQRESLHIANIFWILLLFIIILIFYSGKFTKIFPSQKRLQYISLFFFIFSILLISLLPHIQISAKDHFRKDGISLFNSSSNFVWLEEENKFRIKSDEEYTIYFELRKWKRNISFRFDVPENSSFRVKNGTNQIFTTNIQGESNFNINLSNMRQFKFRGKNLIPIVIRTGSAGDNNFFYLGIEGK